MTCKDDASASARKVAVTQRGKLEDLDAIGDIGSCIVFVAKIEGDGGVSGMDVASFKFSSFLYVKIECHQVTTLKVLHCFLVHRVVI